MIRVGVLTPHAEAGPDVELPEMAPGRVVTEVSRIPALGATADAPGAPPTSSSGLRALTAPSVLDDAVAAFVGASVDLLCHASTSTAYAIGYDAEATMLDRLSKRWELPVAGASVSACAALQALRVQRVALVHPPWFGAEMNELGAAYFRSQGFVVVSARSADLANDPSRIEPAAVVDWVSHHVDDDEAEAVFIGGTGFRAARAIATLERRLGRPVLQSNQVLLWSILTAMEADIDVGGYGRLLDSRQRDEFAQ